MTEEEKRLEEDRNRTAYWRRWGPYVSQRQWGTVREDYSAGGMAWEYFPHDHARSRAYRWGEDGIFGISDNHQRLCFALALWNGRDPILKERFFGLTGNEGNHGEDVKEYYFFLDNTPTHSYMEALYKYPHRAFPYQALVEENRRRSRSDPEYELLDTGVFDEDRYFDVSVRYAKASPEDILIQISAVNRGRDPAALHLLPTIWFRNTWSWGRGASKPSLCLEPGSSTAIRGEHESLGTLWLAAEEPGEALFTENETNFKRLFGVSGGPPYAKDGVNDYIVHGDRRAVNPGRQGTKAALHYERTLRPGETWSVRLRLARQKPAAGLWGPGLAGIMDLRKREADAFYETVAPRQLSPDAGSVHRQALAGLLWTKQYYNYVVKEWLEGDPAQPPPPPGRKEGRNSGWPHFYSEDVLSMPDSWEFPWFAAWDLAFHCAALAPVDPDFAKRQLALFTREWYMHPNGQLPAYEWGLSDANPPVHAWAAWQVYRTEEKTRGRSDKLFLERVFQKLLLNFTWWVNRKDAGGNNVFEGGFLGLDNIGVFDRDTPLSSGGLIEQSDGTSWMAMYCLDMLQIALELAHSDPAYEDIASKFFEHFLYITDAMRRLPGGLSLWDEEDGFFYDTLSGPDGSRRHLKVRSMVGLIPLFGVLTIEPAVFRDFPGFARRFKWFMANRPELAHDVTCRGRTGVNERTLLSVVSPEMLRRICGRLFSESEFLSPHGIRALSRYHKDHPYTLRFDGQEHTISYEPGESRSGLFGGNSNWRGPVWMPVNFLIIESLKKFHHYLGDGFKVEFPTGSGRELTLSQAATELSLRLSGIFLRDGEGRRALYRGKEKFQSDPNWKDLILFHEYFHGDTGAGLGASHQTGWTALVSKLIQQCAEAGKEGARKGASDSLRKRRAR